MKLCQPKNFRKMFREIMAITSQMMTLRSLICLLENQNGGKLQKNNVNILLMLFLFILIFQNFDLFVC
jgi:hypothetical protein